MATVLASGLEVCHVLDLHIIELVVTVAASKRLNLCPPAYLLGKVSAGDED